MEVGEEGDGDGGRSYIYNTYRYTVTTRMTYKCIKMGSDESHFKVKVQGF